MQQTNTKKLLLPFSSICSKVKTHKTHRSKTSSHGNRTKGKCLALWLFFFFSKTKFDNDWNKHSAESLLSSCFFSNFFLKRNKLKTLDPNWWLQRISSNQTTSSFIFHLNIRFEVLVRRNSGPRMDLWVLIHGFESIHTYHLNLSLWIYMMFMSLITNLSSSFVPKSIQKKVDQEQFERWNWFFKTFFDYFSF